MNSSKRIRFLQYFLSEENKSDFCKIILSQNFVMSQGVIRKLDLNTILNLCVNQVIIDLATCVKELVENSLDAGSTKIEIILKEYGKEGIEVIDNGSGIGSDNLENIAQKGATSKLKEFEDLESLETFGFRGEALNAISVLSQLSITTRTERDSMGYKYTFNQDNTIKSKQSFARERGTTVSLKELFGSFPVRKQEFIKNILGQFNKLVNLMTEYALISTNCQICLVNMTAKKGREMILNSGLPTKTILEKATQVFSRKITDQLVECKFEFGEDSRVSEGYILGRVENISFLETKQLIKNMPFLYANSRPINPFKKMTTIFNEIYKKYNSSTRYMYILNLQVKKDSVDYNLSPDKRDICMKQEPEFLNALREQLVGIFQKRAEQRKILHTSVQGNKKDICYENVEGNQIKKKIHLAQKEEEGINNLAKLNQNRGQGEGIQENNSFGLDDFRMDIQNSVTSKSISNKSALLDDFQVTSSNSSAYNRLAKKAIEEIQTMTINEENSQKIAQISQFSSENIKLPNIIQPQKQPAVNQHQSSSRYKKCQSAVLLQAMNSSSGTNLQIPSDSHFKHSTQNDFSKQIFSEHNYFGEPYDEKILLSKPTIIKGIVGNLFTTIEEPIKQQQEPIIIQNNQAVSHHPRTEEDTIDEFTAEINDKVDKKLIHGAEFKKDYFADLSVIGQFSNAFIITFWPSYNQLFLIDQHASDEQIKFEKLLKENVFHSELLANPIQLPITSLEADILNTHKEVFRRNGFSFTIVESISDKSSILKVNQLPVSKHIQFDINDFDELFSNLCSEGTDPETLRPSKIQDILASKACKLAITVGTKLEYEEMKQLLRFLAVIDSPWKCHHGRSTMIKVPPFVALASQISTKKIYSL